MTSVPHKDLFVEKEPVIMWYFKKLMYIFYALGILSPSYGMESW